MKKRTFYRRLGSLLKHHRLTYGKHGLTQHRLGKYVGRSQPTISRIERGESINLDVNLIFKLFTVVGINPIAALAECSARSTDGMKKAGLLIFKRAA